MNGGYSLSSLSETPCQVVSLQFRYFIHVTLPHQSFGIQHQVNCVHRAESQDIGRLQRADCHPFPCQDCHADSSYTQHTNIVHAIAESYDALWPKSLNIAHFLFSTPNDLERKTQHPFKLHQIPMRTCRQGMERK